MRTARQTIEGMTLAFDPAAAGDLAATIQFEVSGAEPGAYHLDIEGGRCRFNEGRSEVPTLTIRTPSDVWPRIAAGEVSGRDALLDGLYEVGGDASLLFRMDRIFSRDPEAAAREGGRRLRPGPIALSGSRWLTVAFLPWLVLWFGPLFGLAGPAAWRLAFPLAAALAAYHAAFSRATWFEIGSTVALGAGALLSLAAPGNAALATWGSAADSLTLGVVWLASLPHGRRPLTADYSRWDHAEALADNGTFLHVNLVITFLWGAAFVIMGSLAVAALLWPGASTGLEAARWLVLVPAIVATIRLPRRASSLRIADLEGSGRLYRRLAVAGIVLAVTAVVVAAARL